MLPIGLNHMTVPHASARGLLDMASKLSCVGVELRNDLGKPLFDGVDPKDFSSQAKQAGLRILALAEVKAFNTDPEENRTAAEDLIATAAECGAEGVALIPLVGTIEITRDAQRLALRKALDVLQPILENYGMRGLIEPLGFVQSSLRFKEDVVSVLDDLNRPGCFGLIHDTFHHHLAGGGRVYADITAIVHISGVSDRAPTVEEMVDGHRILVDQDDRLENIGQLQALIDDGYTGPASFEAFAEKTQNHSHPVEALAGSIAFITSKLTAPAVGAA
jgi:2-keto-myo-inositol isomerase